MGALIKISGYINIVTCVLFFVYVIIHSKYLYQISTIYLLFIKSAVLTYLYAIHKIINMNHDCEPCFLLINIALSLFWVFAIHYNLKKYNIVN